jgi:hypothetical protein
MTREMLCYVPTSELRVGDLIVIDDGESCEPQPITALVLDPVAPADEPVIRIEYGDGQVFHADDSDYFDILREKEESKS